MRKIDIEALMELRVLGLDETAKQLFPDNLHPVPALKRVMNGKALLDSDQICMLSAMTGIPINDLFLGGWSSSINKSIVTFKLANYTAVTNRTTWVTSIYHNDRMFYQEVIMSGHIPVSQFLNRLDKIIEDYESDEF